MTKRLRRYFTCPAEFTFHVLGGKWRGATIAHLSARPMRYSDFRRAIPQLSDKVLTATLRELSELGILSRSTADRESAGSKVYRLTAKGQAMAPMLRLACAWARAHAAEYGVNFLHGPPCAPDALEVESRPVVTEASMAAGWPYAQGLQVKIASARTGIPLVVPAPSHCAHCCSRVQTPRRANSTAGAA